jgi:hypothetical protein
MNPCPGGALIELLELLLKGQDTPGRILNVAGTRTVTVEQAALELGELLGRMPRFVHGAGAPQSMLVDTRRLRSLIGENLDLPLF